MFILKKLLLRDIRSYVVIFLKNEKWGHTMKYMRALPKLAGLFIILKYYKNKCLFTKFHLFRSYQKIFSLILKIIG